jgi:transcriptional regulator with XRE-family HTH domain
MDKQWLKTALRKAGKTSADLAQAIGRDRAVVSRITNGHQKLTIDQAKIFARELDADLADVLLRAGLTDRPTAQIMAPGFSESDAAAWVPGPALAEGAAVRGIAAVLGADRPGVDIWRVRSRAMQLAGYLPDDFILVDTHAAERARPGDTVIAQVYNNATGTAATVLRRLDPPVLTAASADPEDCKAHVVDGVNVLVRGRVVASWRV